MKKIYLLFTAFLFLSAMSVSAGAPCDNERGYYGGTPSCKIPCTQPYNTQQYAQERQGQNPCQKSCQKPCEKICPSCPKEITPVCPGDNFLCTNKDAQALYKCVGLSDSQICTAEKINEKYQLEVLSLNERLDCEYNNRGDLKSNCASRKDLRASDKTIKELKKERKKICECYEKQFKSILSDPQIKAYNKYKKQ